MAKKRDKDESRTEELLAKLLAVHLHGLGVPQATISRILGKRNSWVNELIQGVPKGKTG